MDSHFQALQTIPGFQNGKAVRLQDVPNETAHAVIVVHDKSYRTKLLAGSWTLAYVQLEPRRIQP